MKFIIGLVGFITAFIFLIFSIVLLQRDKPKYTSNKIFAGFLSLNILLIVFSYLFMQNILRPKDLVLLYFFIASLYYLVAPILYLYFHKSITGLNLLSFKLLLHFVPLTACFLYLSLGYFIRLSGAEDINNVRLWTDTNFTLYIISLHIQIFIYVLLSAKLVKNYFNDVKKNFSDLSKFELNWYKLVLAVFIIHWFLDITTAFVAYWYKGLVEISELFSFSALLAFASIVVYRGLKNDSVLLTSVKEKYSNSSITVNQKSEYVNKLKMFMENKKPYLSPELTLKELADLIEIHPKYLSQIINETFHQNFFDFINGYRVEEAKRRLQESTTNGNKTILELLYDVGFNSKSAFNRAFKKQLGITPTQFKKSQLSLQPEAKKNS